MMATIKRRIANTIHTITMATVLVIIPVTITRATSTPIRAILSISPTRAILSISPTRAIRSISPTREILSTIPPMLGVPQIRETVEIPEVPAVWWS
jgi:hypothetical protein